MNKTHAFVFDFVFLFYFIFDFNFCSIFKISIDSHEFAHVEQFLRLTEIGFQWNRYGPSDTTRIRSCWIKMLNRSRSGSRSNAYPKATRINKSLLLLRNCTGTKVKNCTSYRYISVYRYTGLVPVQLLTCVPVHTSVPVRFLNFLTVHNCMNS